MAHKYHNNTKIFISALLCDSSVGISCMNKEWKKKLSIMSGKLLTYLWQREDVMVKLVFNLILQTLCTLSHQLKGLA